MVASVPVPVPVPVPAPSRWPWVAALAVVVIGIHLWGLYRVTGPPGPTWFPGADKAEHLVGFAVPVLLVLLTVELAARQRAGRSARRAALTAAVVAFAAHGVLSEIVQHVAYPTRTGDPADVVADWVGVVVGWLLFVLLVGRSRSRPLRSRSPGSGGARARV